MTPFQYIRATITLVLAPPLTFLVSALAWLDLTCFRRSADRAHVFPKIWGKILCNLPGVKVKIEGLENISLDQTYIFVGNHVSQYDIFSFQGYFPHDFRWIAKKELFKIPLFGHAMKKVGIIPIDRSRGRQAIKSLDNAARQIAAGTSVLIFPEGTRSPDGTLQEFKVGAIMLAIKAGVPVVPLGFDGSYNILPKGKLLANSGTITIRIGKPLATDHYRIKDKQELATALHREVANLL